MFQFLSNEINCKGTWNLDKNWKINWIDGQVSPTENSV